VRDAIVNIFFFLVLGLSVGVAFLKPEVGYPRFVVSEPASVDMARSGSPVYSEDFLPEYDGAPEVHAASVVETSTGDVLAVWYGGTREGAKDVAIYGAVLEREAGTWTPLGPVADRQQTSKDLGRYIKKLGNPVLARDAEGRVWLFYVSVSVGGWSGSSLNYRISQDNGRSWSSAKRLVTSPFLNVSTLVKGTPVLLEDGSLGLPVYHEFAGKFAEFLRVSPEGEVLDKRRISWGRTSLQPIVLPVDRERALALLRYAGDPPPRILESHTVDGGRTWDVVQKLDLPNPNAAISGVRTPSGRMLLVYNDLEKDRHNLSLALSVDNGLAWTRIHIIEDDLVAPAGRRRSEFSYPYIIQSSSGTFHLVYTWQKSRIKHVAFNEAWLDRAAEWGRNLKEDRPRDEGGARGG